MSIISRPYFWNEQAAHAKLEEIVWPNGPVCTRCGATDRIGAVTGKGARAGLKFCCRCRKQFRATVGTMFEGSHVPLHKWFQACFLLSAAAKVISPYQLHLRLEVTNKTALGIVNRLAGIIAREESCADDGSQGLDRGVNGRPSETWSRHQRPSRRPDRAGRSCRGWNFRYNSRRQFPFCRMGESFSAVVEAREFERLLGDDSALPRKSAQDDQWPFENAADSTPGRRDNGAAPAEPREVGSELNLS